MLGLARRRQGAVRAMMQRNKKRRQKGQAVRGSATATVAAVAKAPVPPAQKAASGRSRETMPCEEKIDRDADYSPSLPSREKIAKVLR